MEEKKVDIGLGFDNQEAFVDWLHKYPEHKYTEGTISRYVRALDRAEDWMYIKLNTPIWEITDHAEFLKVESTIKDNPEYLILM